MNENLNLVEILKDCQNGTKLIDLSNKRFDKDFETLSERE